MSFHVARPGLFTTLQDLGRKGVGKYGVSVGGAMDPYSLRLANLLLGNSPHATALEITLIGPELVAEADHWIALCGGNLTPHVQGKEISLGRPVFMKKGEVLRFGPCVRGCRTYLAVKGGFSVPFVLGGTGTDLRGKIGGIEGRPLQKGDCIPVNKIKKTSCRPFHLKKKLISSEENPLIRVIQGPEYPLFTRESQQSFFRQTYKVTPHSDRMGYRLQGEVPLDVMVRKELLSSAVYAGTIQVPPDGQPIVLMADSQTIGGYPRIGSVATVDLPQIAQLKPGDVFSFQQITLGEAHSLYWQQEQTLRCLSLAAKNNWGK